MMLYGASHGEQIGVVLDGVPAGVPLCDEDFVPALLRRKGSGEGLTPRRESDRVRLVSGVYNGFTTGGAITIQVENRDVRSCDYALYQDWPRPGHADYVAQKKYGGFADLRGGGFFSGRMTVGLVLAGVVARHLLPDEVKIEARVAEVGGVREDWNQLLHECVASRDSVGGVVECRVSGCPVGWGDPFFDSIESLMAHLIYSIPGVTAVEFGHGMGATRMRGSEYNNAFVDAQGHMQGNSSGGVVGGVTHGGDLVLRVGFRPAASIGRIQSSFNFSTQRMEEHSVEGRHDVCFVLRTPVIVESAVAFVLADSGMRASRDLFCRVVHS